MGLFGVLFLFSLIAWGLVAVAAKEKSYQETLVMGRGDEKKL